MHDLRLSDLTPERLEQDDGRELVMGLAKVGQYTRGKRPRMLQSEKTPHICHLLFTSAFGFLCIRLKDGHKEDKDKREGEERDGFNVATTVVRWQLGCDGAIVQSCF